MPKNSHTREGNENGNQPRKRIKLVRQNNETGTKPKVKSKIVKPASKVDKQPSPLTKGKQNKLNHRVSEIGTRAKCKQLQINNNATILNQQKGKKLNEINIDKKNASLVQNVSIVGEDLDGEEDEPIDPRLDDGIQIGVSLRDSDDEYREVEDDDNHSESDSEPNENAFTEQREQNQDTRKVERRKSLMEKLSPEMIGLLDELLDEREKEKKETTTADKTGRVTGITPTKQTKINEPTKNNNRRVQQANLVKSPSDTTIYRPALRHNKESEKLTPLILNEQASLNTKNVGDNMYEKISNFVESLRLEQDKFDDEEELEHQRRSIGTQPGTSGNQEKAEAVKRTEKLILDAEKFKAKIAEPTQGTLSPQVMIQCVEGPTNNLFDDRSKSSSNLGGSELDGDDEFFHLTCHIDKGLQTKIEQGHFVDLEKLLPRNRPGAVGGAPVDNTRLEWVHRDGQTFLAPVQNKGSNISNVRKWEQAFRIYAAIYSGANPARAKEIWQYVYTINLAASTYTWENVANYDYTFRQLMEYNPQRSWAKIYSQMWNLAMKDPINRSQKLQSREFSHVPTLMKTATTISEVFQAVVIVPRMGRECSTRTIIVGTSTRASSANMGKNASLLKGVVTVTMRVTAGIPVVNSKRKNKIKRTTKSLLKLLIYMLFLQFNFNYLNGTVTWFENFDMRRIITPVKIKEYEKLLKESGYNGQKTKKLIKGFKYGFDLHYNGEKNVQRTATNLKLRIGSKEELWNKVMKEVEAKRFAGPFKKVPFKNYIQSPIGLVPKDNGTKTRLIFHLSYPKQGQVKSVNASIPRDFCTVKYNDFDMAVQRCIEEGILCSIGKSDMSMAFRNLGMSRKSWKFLVMRCEHPITGEVFWFFDKCLPFGSSISCKHFQDFSDSIAHIVKFRTKKATVNYLDDFFFAALRKMLCDWQIGVFLEVCKTINFPVSLEKTFWGCTCLTFLGLLLDTEHQLVCIPVRKVERAVELIKYFLNTNNKKTTVQNLQKLCGFLNFLCKAIVPGRTFTRRLYANLSSKLKPHHHLKITAEMRSDLEVWMRFLQDPSCYSRPFMDYREWTAVDIEMYSDASRNWSLGFGGICKRSWQFSKWSEFTKEVQPSIQYLEMFAVTSVILTWIHRFKNMRILLHCDNKGCVDVLNGQASNCKNCMVLLRIITLECLKNNTRIKAEYIESEKNILSDALSRMNFDRFWKNAPDDMEEYPTSLPEAIWPMEKVWVN